MITLTNGHVQNLAGLAVPGGSIQLVLGSDATVIASPFGFVAGGIPISFLFDSTGSLSGVCKIWSNAELNPTGTYYLVNFYDSSGSRINDAPLVWVFSQTIGQSVDIGNIIPASSGSPSYPGAVLLSPVGNQVISVGNLTLTVGDFNVTAGSYRVAGAAPTGTGALVAQTTPTLITPVLGAATATSINKVSITPPASTATLAIANNKTATINNTLTLAGTDGTTLTGPASPPTGGVLAFGVPKFQQFTAGGTFTIPTGVTGVKVIVLGGGGAGGGATAANNGGGGGSGGYAIKWLSGLTPGNTIAVTIGAAGTPGAAGANSGGNGGNSSIASGTQTITTVTANGGTGGAANGPASFGGTGGTTTNGDIGITGNVGQLGVGTAGGNGAASALGGTAGQGGFGTAGSAAAGFGSGGGGGGAAGNVSGGAGSAGIVIFEWVI